jgi:hypothetical protein
MDRRRLAALLAAAAVVPALVVPFTRTHLNAAAASGGSVGVAVTAAAGALLIVTVGVRRNTVATSVVACTDNAGAGNVYSDTVAQGAQVGTNGVRQAVLKCRLVAGGTFTITATSASATSMGITVEQFEGASDDLSNVTPMVYHATADPVTTLPSAPSAANIVLAQMTSMSSNVGTVPAGYTTIVSLNPAAWAAPWPWRRRPGCRSWRWP